jgi:hypothetical protein
VIVAGVVSVVFGLFLVSVAFEAFGCDEAGAGALAGMTGTAFILVGLRALSA